MLFDSKSRVSLEPLHASEVGLFTEMVTEHVSTLYPGTESEYAYNLAQAHFLGVESVGLFSRRRVVWSVVFQNSLAGFIVSTEKSGGNVKIGPAVTLPRFWHKGVASQGIDLLSNFYLKKGYHKLYFTVCAANRAAIDLAINSHFSFEARLKRHYSPDVDELVFGKLIHPFSKNRINSNTDVQSLDRYDYSTSENELARMFAKSCKFVDEHFIHRLHEAKKQEYIKGNSFRSRGLFQLDGNLSPMAAIVSSQKRGGAVKFDLATNGNVVDFGFLEEVERFYRYRGSRKAYSMVSNIDLESTKSFLAAGYSVEGILRAPFGQSHSTLIFAKTWR